MSSTSPPDLGPPDNAARRASDGPPGAVAGASWRLLLVDDEALARQRLRKLLTEVAVTVAGVPALEIGEAPDAAAARAALQWRAWQVLLLDIHMPGTDGLALARELREQARAQGQRAPVLVFVTAHADHALAAFEVEAVDYLTKPVRRERLAELLLRLQARLAPPVASGPVAAPAGPAAAVESVDEAGVVVVQDRGRVVRVRADEILWLKAELKYVTVRTAEASWLVDESLAELEGRLGRRFLRIHRNALVAVAALRRLERRASEDAGAAADPAEAGGVGADTWAAQVAPTGEWLAVSRRQVPAVRACLARQATGG